MSRVKKTFKDADGVAHVWVGHNLTGEGQSSAQTSLRRFMTGGKGRTCFFEGSKIYLYGSHYVAGNFVRRTPKSRLAVQFNSDPYSNTTVQKMRDIRDAVKGNGLEIFTLSSPGSDCFDITNVRAYLYEINASIAVQNRSRGTYQIESAREKALQTIAELKAYCKFWHKATGKLPVVPALPKDIEAKREREQLAQTARDEKRAAERKLQHEAWERANQERIQKYKTDVADWNANYDANIAAWLAGGKDLNPPTIGYYSNTDLEQPRAMPTLLRIVGSNVETSRHAEFPVSHAKRGLALIRSVVARGEAWESNGHTCKLGLYSISRIEANGDVKAGCHFVPYSSILLIAPEVDAYTETDSSDVAGIAY